MVCGNVWQVGHADVIEAEINGIIAKAELKHGIGSRRNQSKLEVCPSGHAEVRLIENNGSVPRDLEFIGNIGSTAVGRGLFNQNESKLVCPGVVANVWEIKPGEPLGPSFAP